MRILLVDDDDALRETLCQALRQAGYGVDPVGNGQSADAALAANAYDLVVLDLGLLLMNGIIEYVELFRGPIDGISIHSREAARETLRAKCRRRDSAKSFV